MIAEIHGKISRTASNLVELREDELTGNVFGSLRYLPFNEGLKPILCNAVFPDSIKKYFNGIYATDWSDNIKFWPYDTEGELDASIEFEDVFIGIEAKYTSGLSSDDGMDYTEETECEDIILSCHQLQRESRIVLNNSKGKIGILLLVADENDCADIYADVCKRKLLDKSDVKFGYISWQSILRQIKEIPVSNPFHQVVLNDITKLLVRKGFEQFHSMELKLLQNIDKKDFFVFNNNQKIELNFNYNLKVLGGKYYEFK